MKDHFRANKFEHYLEDVTDNFQQKILKFSMYVIFLQ